MTALPGSVENRFWYKLSLYWRTERVYLNSKLF
nr:MAG TPA: hypothetical protein [Caudoviricetes sp.]